MRGAWSPDSRFFVFNAQSSGGHQPWHWPAYVYSRRDNNLYSLDDVIGPVVARDFELKARHLIETSVLEKGNNAGKYVTFDLSRVCGGNAHSR
jgi:hypothetical protein